MKIMNAIQKVKNVFEEEGFIRLIIKIFNRISPVTYSKKGSYVFDLDHYENNKPHNKLFNIYSSEIISLEILEKMRKEYPLELNDITYHKIKRRILFYPSVQGYVVTNKNNDICGYFHIGYPFSTKQNNKNNYLVLKPKEDVYGHFHLRNNFDTVLAFDSYTFTKHRRHGVHKYAIIERMKIAKTKGYKYIMSNVTKGNIFSKTNYIKLGFKKSHEYKNYRFMHHTFYYTKKKPVQDYQLN